ncbi:IS21 family transposase [Caminicella sporogenes]|uniref:IS21 family transposase n=1 Tax=Caminicella sporogenes TaxID=166485 RepID=UPI00253FCD32|nr:IS21 family transposase [Caminicella sporogenes]WIF96136.1 IS21 family transposase [Caminicella sporogenes]WIF96140.1 IS21 family transposase [Caminicella sporogenes]WIF96150.1 IS21 family transposase [Caminicella sporogenes]WIF96175.1 IS21 family transposase [Caminicella sporogenes]WIF96184.1 IS21 family transposase [Caminicella sporogenes]
MHTTIDTLFKKGYNKTQIAKMLKIDRKTVRTVLEKLEKHGCVERKEYPSILDPYKEYINIQASKQLSAKRIFQDLQMEYGYEGSYDTVKKYVAKIKKNPPKAYMVLTSLPGEEAQVDFGYIGTIKVNGRHKKAWIFVMTLSYSRYMYVQIVFDQSVKTFIECHKNAFKYFGGVPETVKIDNLKAGILEADFYEPTVQKNYASFAAHYGFWAQPCRVYTPTDKGKVESNVKYVKDNCFKGREFKDFEEAKEFLSQWLENIANVRKHGTTKRVPAEVFNSIEKEKLIPLPNEDFILSKSTKCIVNTNCHISYEANYYSVPYAYIGQEVEAIEINNILKIFYKEKEIALHTLCKDKKGEYITNNEHYPYSKSITSAQILSRQREEMLKIGENALKFFDNFINHSNNKKYDYRSISGILSLRTKYDDEMIDKACKRANTYGAFFYKIIKRICEKGIIDFPTQTNVTYINKNKTNITRDLAEYDKLANLEGFKYE